MKTILYFSPPLSSWSFGEVTPNLTNNVLGYHVTTEGYIAHVVTPPVLPRQKKLSDDDEDGYVLFDDDYLMDQP